MDVVAILEKLQSLNLIRLNKVSGDYYSCYCPFHSDGKERRPSFGILLHDQYRNGQSYPKGFSHCFTCQHADTLPNTITRILKTKSISKSGLDWLKENIPDFEDPDQFEFESLLPKNIVNQLNNKFAIDYIKSATNQAVMYVSESELQGYRFIVPYMYERKLTDEIIEKFDIGYDANYIPKGAKNKVPCITFPVRDIKGNTLFICRRSIKGKNFYLPENCGKSVYGIYEFPKTCKRVIIAESCINALTAYSYGYPAVALLGTGTSYQLDQLKSLGVSEFIIGTDPDEAGDRAAKRIKLALKDVAIVRRMNGIPEGKDLNDLTKEEFVNIYDNRM